LPPPLRHPSLGRRRAPLLRCGLGAFGALALWGSGCLTPEAPLPRPLPPNIDIKTTPSYGATVDRAGADSVILEFSRPMDPPSLLLLRRVSYLLPITVDRVEGYWNTDHTRLVFRLSEFPIQPGATYEALFAGLRTADGELYNHGPHPVLFHVRGTPDIFPIRPEPRIASREFCRRIGTNRGECDREFELESVAIGTDQVALDTRCYDCVPPERRDLFRKSDGQTTWLGFDLFDSGGQLLRTVRWPDPPILFSLPLRRGTLHRTVAAQSSPDGTELARWSSRDAGTDTPKHLVSTPVLPLEINFTNSRVFQLDYEIAPADAPRERRSERWWLYPGVGLVRRESVIERDGEPEPWLETDAFTPPLSSLVH
jgi:hypothetical protein